MKQLRLTSALLMLLMAFVVTSCSKKDEPEPSMGDQVAGTYTLTKFGFSGFTADMPFTNTSTGVTISGKIVVTKVADDKASAVLTLTDKDKAGKVTDDVSTLGEVTLKKATTGEIEAYSGTTKVGTYTGGTITISAVDADLGAVSFVGKKN